VRVAAAMARPVQLNGRLRAILDEDRPRGGSPFGHFATGSLSVVLVVAVAAFTPAAVPLPESGLDEELSGGAEPMATLDVPGETTEIAAVAVAPSEAEPAGVPSDAELAQIHGRITDAVTGQPLRDAQVSRVGSEVVAISSESGAYALVDVPAGTYELRVERVGYATQTRSVALTADAVLETDFALVSEEAAAIPTATVTPTAPDVASDTARRVRLREPGNTITQTRPRPIIYIDGVRVSPPDTTVLSNLSPNEIERIETVVGSEAVARFGPDAAGGVIQIFLKRRPFEVEVEVLQGSPPALDSLVASMSVRLIYVGAPDQSVLREPLVFVDSVRYDGEARRALFETITPEQIERIEVMRGQAAVTRYGAGAERGAILIYRKRP
jgi:hypothetical protein